MNHQAIIDQLTTLAPQLKEASSPEDVLVKYASSKNLSPAQLERIGQVYNIAKTLNFMDKSANRGDSFKVLDTEKMMRDYTKHTPSKQNKEATSQWDNWFDTPTAKAAAASTDYTSIDAWIDAPEKSAKIVEEDGKFTVYSSDGSKRLSKPGTKAEAVKRLRQVEYFKAHKKANTVPNIMAMTQEETYAPFVEDNAGMLPGSSFGIIKDELRKESFDRFELESVNQIIDDLEDDIRKIASELLNMHRMSPIPFATMERDAYYCAADSASVKVASEAIASYFKQNGWDIERHDYNKPAPRLSRDTYNVLPLFKSAADKIETYKSAILYREDFEKKSASQTAGPKQRRERTLEEEAWLGGAGSFPQREKKERSEKKEPDMAPFPERGKERPKPPADKDGISDAELDSIALKHKYPEEEAEGKGNKEDIERAKRIMQGTSELLNPNTYMSQQQKDFVSNIIKSPELATSNKRQQNIDVATKDVGRVATLQRLLLSDPIIGEADPDTVVSLYNTLAKANPEIAEDANLLRFALREAIQYDAVPLHTYKDLISMGKDRAETEHKQHELTSKRYSI
jgi:hypothetical protein